ncbi:MAG: hypothetical protein EZS28_049489, partial [Streblomastix strix]
AYLASVTDRNADRQFIAPGGNVDYVAVNGYEERIQEQMSQSGGGITAVQEAMQQLRQLQ